MTQDSVQKAPAPGRLRPPRDHSLDGLRGLAALVVVVHHSLLAVPLFAAPYFAIRANPAIAWFVYSPLHAVWAGREAVYIFFVLSGLVLALPVLRSDHFDWRSYYPSRLIRLYLPVWASVVLAVIIMTIIPRHAVADDSVWIQGHDQTVTVVGVARDVTLLAGNSGINSALWSLQWEVLFSLLLPAFVWIAVRFARHGYLVIAGSFVAIVVGTATGIDALQFLPLFLIGVVMATNLERIRSVGERINESFKPWLTWLALSVIALLAVTSYWSVSYISGSGIFRLAVIPEVAGAALIVALALVMPPFRRMLQSRAARFIGAISFSIYLTHEPLVVAVSGMLPTGAKGWTLPIVLPLALIVGYVFFRLVEAPSHRLAQLVRRRSSTTPSGEPAPTS